MRTARVADRLRALPWRPVLLSLAGRPGRGAAGPGPGAAAAPARRDLRTEGLLGWDADWYSRIASQGYGALPDEALRFFPLLPLLARGLSPLLLGSEGAALLLLANGGAVLFGLLLHRLVVREGLGVGVADRAVWAAAFAPAAFVHVMGYTEPLYGALVCGLLLALREQRWPVVAALGLAAGALRPPGVVLAVVVLAGALPGVRAAGARQLAGPRSGGRGSRRRAGIYLLWVDVTSGDALLPFRVQAEADLRGGTFVDPLPGVVDAVRGMLAGELAGSGLHVLWAGLAVGLLVVAARRLPVPWVVLGAVTVLLGRHRAQHDQLRAVRRRRGAAARRGGPRHRRAEGPPRRAGAGAGPARGVRHHGVPAPLRPLTGPCV